MQTEVRFDMKESLTVFAGGLYSQHRQNAHRLLRAKLGRSFGAGIVIDRRSFEWIIQPLDDDGQPVQTERNGKLSPLRLSFPLLGRKIPVGVWLRDTGGQIPSS